MTTALDTRTRTHSRNLALVVARGFAGLLGVTGLAGAAYFLLVAPDEAVWVGPWVDVPVVALMLCGMLLKVTLAFAPRLSAGRRLTMGLMAVAIGMAVTLVKIPLYDEPEGVLFLGLDALLLALLLVARRSATRSR